MTSKHHTAKFKELFSTILHYESDTFSASGSELCRQEALLIADKLVCKAIQDLIDTNTMDGIAISSVLEELREKEQDKVCENCGFSGQITDEGVCWSSKCKGNYKNN